MKEYVLNSDEEEIKRFSQLSGEWWKVNGAFAPLHRMTPIRIEFILKALNQGQAYSISDEQPLKNLNIVDVGCGGGILSEPLRRLGAKITGIDASETAIQSARLHSEKSNLEINYLVGTVDRLIEQKKFYDLVIASEVIEHVKDPNDFIKGLKKLLMPKGKIILTTLSRSLKSFLIAKVAAEYLTRIIPIGTHEWKSFLKPEELETLLVSDGFRVDLIRGITYKISSDRFVLTDDLSINYAISASCLDS
jgi:2-polyprenyl-6-hydroxyphenyl methylase/3-demethylubiquinone-9 3-methyltransferase